MSNTNRKNCPLLCKPIAEAIFFSLGEEFCAEAERAGSLLSRLSDESVFSLRGASDLGEVRSCILSMSGKHHAMKQLAQIIEEMVDSRAMADSLTEVLRQNQRLLNELTKQELSVTMAFQDHLDGISLYQDLGDAAAERPPLHEPPSDGSSKSGEPNHTSSRPATPESRSVYVLICAGEDVSEQFARAVTARIAPLIGRVIQEEYGKQA